jgi:YD repeat-containing protein
MVKKIMCVVVLIICSTVKTNATVKTKGVDLFTGKSSFDHHLYTLKGKGEMDVKLSLKYSSANAEDAWERNDNAPTGSFGLGWDLNFGAIITAHKNTVDIDDDQYIWLSSDGTSHRIFKKVDGTTTTFYMEQAPYWRIERTTATVGTAPNTYDVVTQWTLTDMSGKQYIYGDGVEPPPDGTVRNATRYSFSWPESGFIGNGTASGAALYPICWDIERIRDDNGNEVTFEYDQETESIFTSTIQYTKASNLERITNPEGAYILFEWQQKSPGEYVDPYTFDDEPDGFQEFLTTELAKRIAVYNEKEELINQFDFCYKKIRENVENKLGGDYYTKSLLTEIIQSNSSCVESRYVFSYYDDEEEAKKDPDNYCFGALKTVQNDLCGKATYEYKKQEVGGISKTSEDFGELEKFTVRYPGMLSDGTPYMILKMHQKVWLYQWNGWKWKEMKIGEHESGSNLGSDEWKDITCGLDYFIVWTYHYEGEYQHPDHITVYSFDNENWDETHDETVYYANDIFASAKYFIIRNDNSVTTYYWNTTEWVKQVITGTGDIGHKTRLGLDFFTYNKNGTSDLYIAQWNGRTNEFDLNQYGMTKDNILTNNNYIIGWAGRDVEIYNWNGVSWSSGFTKGWKKNVNVYAGDGFTGVMAGAKAIKMYNWTGSDWQQTQTIDNVRKSEAWNPWFTEHSHMALGNDYSIISYPRVIWRYGWNFLLPGLYVCTYIEDGNVKINNWWDNEWNETYKGKWEGSYRSKRFLPGIDFALCVTGFVKNNGIWGSGENLFSPRFPVIWDGNTWVSENNVSIVGDYTLGLPGDDGTAVALGNSYVGNDMLFTGNNTQIQSHMKINGSFEGNVTSYVVSKTIVNDGFTDKDVETVITYDPQHSTFDTRGELPRFSAATVASPGVGKTVYHFFNGYSDDNYSDQEDMNEQYEKLGGLVYLQEDFSESEKLVGSITRDFEVYPDPDDEDAPDWPDAIYDIRLKEKTDNTKGVTSTYEVLDYEDENGLPADIQVVNSNGDILIENRKYAFKRYADMGPEDAHILTPVCENVFYKDVKDADHVQTATATTWSDALKAGTWKVEKKFAWNGESSYEDYWTTPEDWQPTGENLFFDDHGYLMTEAVPNTNLKYSKIRGIKNTLPSATITNAKFHECAVFTGDFDDNPTEDTYYDENELWEKGGTSLSATVVHFGENSVRVPSSADGISGTARGLDPEKDYLFTAWVYPSRACDATHFISLSFNKEPATTPLPPDVTFEALLAGNNPDGGWQKISAVVSAEFLAGMDPTEYKEEDDNSLTFTLSGTDVDFYVDDLRFHPKKALVRTTYYDQLRRQPIASVDFNGNVESVRYDDQGRPVLWLDNKGRELAQREYCLARCNTKEGDGSLKSLKVENKVQTDVLDVGAATKEYTLFYENSIEQVTVKAEAEHEEARLNYRINNGAWVEQLCGCNLEIPLTLVAGVEYKVDVMGVAPSGKDDDNIMYTVFITRSENCWVALGDASIAAPKGIAEAEIVVAQNTPYCAYVDDDGSLQSKNYVSNAWTSVAEISTREAGMISMSAHGTNPYIAYVQVGSGDQVYAKKFDGTTWTGVETGASVIVSPDEATSPDIKVSSTGIPFVAYIGDIHQEPNNSGTGVDNRLIVKKFESGAWVPASGSWSALAVSDESALEPVLGFSPAGVLYVAYIAVDSDDDNDINDDDGRLIVKKLDGGVWTAVGDWVNGPPSAGCQQLSLGFLGEKPCVAYAEAPYTTSGGIQSVSSGDELVVQVKVYDELQSWLPPFRQDIPANYSHWVYVGPSALFRTSIEDAFQLISDGTTLYLQFENMDNNHFVTTIDWDGSVWRSVGNPGYAMGSASGSIGRFNGQVTSTALYASFNNKMRSGEQGVYTYDLSESCSDATLCDLDITSYNGTFVPEFRQYILNYSLEVENNVSTITFDPTVCTSGNTVNVYANGSPASFPVDLIVGKNHIEMEVVSADGEARKRYTVTVTRKASAFASLCNFTIYSESSIGSETEIDYTPAFDADVMEYTVSGDFPGEYVYVRPVNNGNSTIYVKGMAVGSGNTTLPIELYFGENRIPIKVVAADGVTSRTYFLTLTTTVPNVVGLSDIVPSAGTLQPTFSAETFNYTVEVPYGATQIQFTPSSNGAIITMDGLDEPITSGDQTDPFNLTIGDQNEFVFIGSETLGSKGVSYRIKVIRAPGTTTQLTSLSILDDTDPGANVSLTPAFSSTHLSYSAGTVVNGIRALRITPEAGASSTIFISGAMTSTPSGVEQLIPLEEGLNKITITVTDGTESADYHISVIRQSSVTTSDSYIAFFQGNPIVDEDEGKIVLPVTLNKAVSDQVTVDYRVVAGGSASQNLDYRLEPGTLVFEKCEQTSYIEVEIVDNKIPEQEEWFEIVLENPTPSGDVVVPTNGGVLKCTIRDDDYYSVSFATESSSEFENVADPGVEVTLSDPFWEPVTVYLSIEGQPKGVSNYDVTGTKVTFLPSEPLTQTIPVDILDDMIFEGDESFVVKIVNTDNAVIGTIKSHIHRIKDDESSVPTVYFTARSGSGPESSNYPDVTAVIYPAPAGAVTVPFSLSGSATSDDYTCENDPQQLVFSPSVTSSTVQLNITNDGNNPPEPAEMIVVTLETPQGGGAELGDPSTFIYTITNDNTKVRYVQENITTSGNGTDWGDGKAYKYLQDALTEARDNPGTVNEIRVAAGTYFPDVDWASRPDGDDDINATFAMIDGVTLKGGYPANGGVTRDWIANATTLNGNIQKELPYPGRNSAHVVTGANAVIDGFTIQEGGSEYSGGGSYSTQGGGMLSVSCTPYIVNCRFTQNHAISKGAALYCESSTSEVIVENCIFVDNPKFDYGLSGLAGIAVACENTDLNVKGCHFNRNKINGSGTSTIGGAIYFNGGSTAPYKSLTISGTEFIENIIQSAGGAIYVDNYSELSISDNCVFNYNVSNGSGGAIFVSSGTGSIAITDTKFKNNHAGTSGSGGTGGALMLLANTIQSLTMENCVFEGNTATNGSGVFSQAIINSFKNCVFIDNNSNQGGGVFINGSSGDQNFINCIFANQSATNGAGIYATIPSSTEFKIYNCTFYYNWGNTGAGIYFGYSTAPVNQPEIKNTIIWNIPGHSTGAFYPGNCTPVVTGSCIQDYTSSPDVNPPGFNNVSDSRGTDGVYGTDDDGLRLASGSRCIGLGTDYPDMSLFPVNSSGDPIDITKGLRVKGTIDAGAYELDDESSVVSYRYVRSDIASPALPGSPGAGQSWDNAYKYLQDALNEVRSNSGIIEIRVGQGTYYPDQHMETDGSVIDSDSPYDRFELVDGLSIIGGYTSAENRNSDREGNGTILSGDIESIKTRNIVVLTDEKSQATLDGLIIEEGFGGTGVAPPAYPTGSAIYCVASLMTLRNITVRNNTSEYQGPVWNGNHGSLVIDNCLFENNLSQNGGAIYSNGPIYAENSTFQNQNPGPIGGAYTKGGAVYIADDQGSVHNFISCVFLNNKTESTGGAVYHLGIGKINLLSCQFENNSAGTASIASKAGAVYIGSNQSSIQNCTFTGNSCTETNGGGAIYFNDCSGTHELISVTFTNNTANGIEYNKNCP